MPVARWGRPAPTPWYLLRASYRKDACDGPTPQFSAHMINVRGIAPGVDDISHGSAGEPECLRYGLCYLQSDRLTMIAPPPTKAASVYLACCGSPVC
jgi:hypothetical protein